jgi:hypothetical protein
VAVALLTPLLITSRAAADGQPVAGFGVNGVVIDSLVTQGNHVSLIEAAELPDGSVMVTGSLTGPITATGRPNFLARYTPAGQLDPSFGVGGVSHLAFQFADLTPMRDGTVLAILYTAASKQVISIAANGAGTILLSLGGQVDQLIARPDGAVIAIGQFVDSTRPAARFEARVIRPDGRVDSTFVGDLSSVLPPFPLGPRPFPLHHAVLLTDGRLIIADAHVTANGATCTITALNGDGTVDSTFGVNGAVDTSTQFCRVDRFVDDEIRAVDFNGTGALGFSPDGQALGKLVPPFDRTDLAFEGTGYFYTHPSSDTIEALDPFGDVDPFFGVGGSATFPGIDIARFKLLDSGDILAWGIPTGNDTSLALVMISASFGTALQPPAVDTTKFVPLPPLRILDTREGLGAPQAKLGVGGQIDLQIAGVGGVPATGVSAVVLNVTATEATRAGYVSAYPSGTRRPIVSNLNLDLVGQTAANLVTVKVGANGKVTLFTSGGTHLVADVAGYYTPVFTSADGRLQSGTPERILDTRLGLGAPQAKLVAGQQLDLQVTGRGPVPATGVSAVVLNITGDQASLAGFVTAWPAGIDRPVVSNLNLVAGETRANLAIVPVGAGGKVSLFTSGGTELIADVAGWFTDATMPDDSVGLFVPISPTRVLDTRQESTAPTAPLSALIRRIGSTTVVPPNATTAIAANITVTESAGPGFVTAWPADTQRPVVSNLNTTRVGQTIPNAAIVPLGLDDLALFTQSGAHLIIDINGWFTNF